MGMSLIMSLLAWTSMNEVSDAVMVEKSTSQLKTAECRVIGFLTNYAHILDTATITHAMQTKNGYAEIQMGPREDLNLFSALYAARVSPEVLSVGAYSKWGDSFYAYNGPSRLGVVYRVVTRGLTRSSDIVDDGHYETFDYGFNVNYSIYELSNENEDYDDAITHPIHEEMFEDHRAGSEWQEALDDPFGFDRSWEESSSDKSRISYRRILFTENQELEAMLLCVVSLDSIAKVLFDSRIEKTGRIFLFQIKDVPYGQGRYRTVASPSSEQAMYSEETELTNRGAPITRILDKHNQVFESTSTGYIDDSPDGIGWVLFTDPTLPPYLLVAVTPISEFLEEANFQLRKLILISGVVLGVAILCALSFWYYIRATVCPLISSMTYAQRFEFDMIKQKEFESSKIKEIKQIGESFTFLVMSLKEYMRYLPLGILNVNNDMSWDDRDGLSDIPPPPAKDNEITIVFTDIQNSTLLWAANDMAMSDSLYKHNTTIREAIRAYSGYEVKVIGDAFMLAFKNSEDAIGFALTVQQSLMQTAWLPELINCLPICNRIESQGNVVWNGLRVRIGINRGKVTTECNPLTERIEYCGDTVRLAASIEGLACGGMVLMPSRLYDEYSLTSSGEKTAAIRYDSQEIDGFDEISVTAVMPQQLSGRSKDMYLRTNAWKRENRKSLSSSVVSSPSASRSGRRSKKRVVVDRKLNTKLIPGVGSVCFFEASPSKSGDSLPIMNILSTIEEATERTLGSVLHAQGSRAAIVWNCGVKSTGHAFQSLRFAARTYYEFDGLCKSSFGIATGNLLHGNIGGVRRRFHVVVGGTPRLASILGNFALRAEAGILFTDTAEYPSAFRDPSLAPFCRVIWLLEASESDQRISIVQPDLGVIVKAWNGSIPMSLAETTGTVSTFGVENGDILLPLEEIYKNGDYRLLSDIAKNNESDVVLSKMVEFQWLRKKLRFHEDPTIELSKPQPNNE